MVWFQNFGSNIFFKPYPTQNLFQWNFAFPCPPILKKWFFKTVLLDLLGLPCFGSIWVHALLIKQLKARLQTKWHAPQRDAGLPGGSKSKISKCPPEKWSGASPHPTTKRRTLHLVTHNKKFATPRRGRGPRRPTPRAKTSKLWTQTLPTTQHPTTACATPAIVPLQL